VDATVPDALSGIKDLAGLLAEHGVRFAYLFGSRAEGTNRETSDIDLAVFVPGAGATARFRCTSRIQRELRRKVVVDVEVVSLSDASPVLRFEAMRPGCVVYCDDEEFRLALELRWFREYEDFRSRQLDYMGVLADQLEERRGC